MPDAVLSETSDPARLPARPRVSVLMIAYNHAEYLAQAIESIVGQDCDFDFELIIGEDHSPDGSLAIALAYQRRHPDRVRVLHADRNIGMNANSRRVRAAARGDYLAWCEGDDYWCDARKLADQVALLDADPQLGAVHTDWVRARRLRGDWVVDSANPVHRRSARERLEGELLPSFYDPRILRTCTLMFRAAIARECDASIFSSRNYPFGDTVTAFFITRASRVGYLPRVTAVYRESEHSAMRSGLLARLALLDAALEFDHQARALVPAGKRYPDAYRVELAAGMVLWGLRGLRAGWAWRGVSRGLGYLGPRRFLRGLLQALAVRRGHRNAASAIALEDSR